MAGILNDRVNLGVCKLTANLAASASSVSVDDASVFSSLGDFYATLMPSDEVSRFSNSEIVKCTYVNDTTLAIVRAQRGTTARAFNAGAILSNGIYTEDIDQMQSVGDVIFSTTFNSTTSTYTISSGNSYLPALPTNGMRITIKAGAANASQAKLDLQGLGVSYNIMTGTGTNTGSVSHSTAMLKNNEVYELVFDGTQWLCTNLLGGSGTSGLIGTADIAGSAVTTAKINDGAVTTGKISDLNVTTGKLANGAVTGVANNATAIGTAKLALATVGTPNLRDSAVTGAKIANTTIGGGKIANTTITPGKLNFASSTHYNYFWSGSGTGMFTQNIDVSAIPAGARFLCFATGYVNLNQDGAAAIQMAYNNVNSQPTWADMKGGKGAVPMSNGGMWTKVSGYNTLTFFTTYANGLNDRAFNVFVWAIM